MKRFLKILAWSLVSVVVLLGILLAGFAYKVKNGFPVSYETEAPAIDIPADRTTVLLFSKATGFRHGESIEAGKKVFAALAGTNNWFLYDTEAGGVFNRDQLAKFDVVIFNNSTGRVLNDEQQKKASLLPGHSLLLRMFGELRTVTGPTCFPAPSPAAGVHPPQ